MIGEIKKELRKSADKEKAKILMRFFKTGKGEYGAGDRFLGVVMPEQRKIVKKYFAQISLAQTLKLLQSKFHEERMTALVILVSKFKKGREEEQKQIFKAYLANTKYINNWDLVDVTCRDIVGAYLFERDRKILYKLARSKNLWERRIVIVSTFYFIAKNDLNDTYKIVKILLDPTSPRLPTSLKLCRTSRGTSNHDLIHKAVGWALREAGKRDKPRLVKFLNENISKMPRTTLRYAIEKFPPAERKKFLSTPPTPPLDQRRENH